MKHTMDKLIETIALTEQFGMHITQIRVTEETLAELKSNPEFRSRITYERGIRQFDEKIQVVIDLEDGFLLAAKAE